MSLVGEPKGAIQRERRRLQRGVLDPNPGLFRAVAPLAAFASSPTITEATGTATTPPASTISGSALIPMTNAAFRYFSSDMEYKSAIGADHSFYVPTFPSTTTSTTRRLFSVDFETDASVFEVYTKGLQQNYRILVDGAPDPTGVRVGSTNDNNQKYIKVDFGSSVARRITLECDLNFLFGGVLIDKTYSLWPSHFPLGPKVIVIGDSYTFGTGSSPSFASWEFESYNMLLRPYLGWWDMRPSGVGGTGYLNNGGSLFTFRQRVQADVISRNPDIVIMQGSSNDQSFTPTQVQTEAELLYAQIRAGLPSAILIVLSVFECDGSPTAANQANHTAINAAAATYAHLTIDPMTAGWFTGTGRVGATNGTGNADRYQYSDSIHPSADGHAYIARRIAAEISAASARGVF
jgi:lysophospholipase L1-like esterase